MLRLRAGAMVGSGVVVRRVRRADLRGLVPGVLEREAAWREDDAAEGMENDMMLEPGGDVAGGAVDGGHAVAAEPRRQRRGRVVVDGCRTAAAPGHEQAVGRLRQLSTTPGFADNAMSQPRQSFSSETGGFSVGRSDGLRLGGRGFSTGSSSQGSSVPDPPRRRRRRRRRPAATFSAA
ncbi:hypothetical protein JL721_6927 [Aureococcus anophagefferens]|nr:hypothetical protein JL721_6927 [Aureococcus anophagefferens]